MMTVVRSFALACAAIAAVATALAGSADATSPRDTDGQLFGVVREGVLMHYRADCSMDGLYLGGQSIAEKGGPEYVHIGRNPGPGPLVLQVLYIDPAGAPLSDDQPDPGCGFA